MPNDAALTVEFLERMNRENAFSAVEHLHAGFSTDPAANAQFFMNLLIDAYWKHKNLPAVVMLATAGIEYCMAQSRLAADPASAAKLRSTAKGLAYNLASFTWPGWGEPGVQPTPDQVALGLHAARYNLQLAYELQKPPEKIRNAHWLLGAHLLASAGEGNARQALDHLRQAMPPEDDAYFSMFHGYVLLAQLLAGEAVEAEWNKLQATLAAQNTDPARFSLAQLTTAHQILCAPVMKLES